MNRTRCPRRKKPDFPPPALRSKPRPRSRPNQRGGGSSNRRKQRANRSSDLERSGRSRLRILNSGGFRGLGLFEDRKSEPVAVDRRENLINAPYGSGMAWFEGYGLEPQDRLIHRDGFLPSGG